MDDVKADGQVIDNVMSNGFSRTQNVVTNAMKLQSTLAFHTSLEGELK